MRNEKYHCSGGKEEDEAASSGEGEESSEKEESDSGEEAAATALAAKETSKKRKKKQQAEAKAKSKAKKKKLKKGRTAGSLLFCHFDFLNHSMTLSKFHKKLQKRGNPNRMPIRTTTPTTIPIRLMRQARRTTPPSRRR